MILFIEGCQIIQNEVMTPKIYIYIIESTPDQIILWY